ncbi:alpha/beta hydrolase [Salaquimonas pukyongi]|uniref:alpha/beta hydrolase n=1 Tax=Salaquimonas pukyongi TaxID=2712698 RepID=UPI00096B9043|nr:alpha/beta hydrolase [Salaquimonas pukyongi]
MVRIARVFAAPAVIVLILLSTLAAAAQELKAGVPVGFGQHVDIYVPDAAKPKGLFQIRRKVPVLLYVHGGGWIKGDTSRVYNLPSFANSRGYMLVSASYRPVPRTNIDGQVKDVIRAINWTRKNIARYGGNPKKIVIMGHSAGAHLVSMVGVQKKAGPLRGIVANDVQAYDMVAYASIRGGIDGVYLKAFGQNPDNWIRWSPVTYARRSNGFPPFLVMYSRSHRPRRAIVSVAFARELRRRGTNVTLFNGSRYSHGSIARGIGTSAEVTRALDNFLRRAYR